MGLNPMELVDVKNASKRASKPRTMTIEEFHRLSAILTEPYKTMATVGVCLGLRWSEIVGLKWQDINWIDGELKTSTRRVIGFSRRRRKMASFRAATHHFGRSWGEPVTIRASSTFHRTAFGTAIVRGWMSWARQSLCSNAPCDTETSA